jgi:hypothetical protein
MPYLLEIIVTGRGFIEAFGILFKVSIPSCPSSKLDSGCAGYSPVNIGVKSPTIQIPARRSLHDSMAFSGLLLLALLLAIAILVWDTSYSWAAETSVSP